MKFFDKKVKKNKGMSYVELIVVLSIFSIMSAFSIYNYRTFENKVEIKNLANNIATKLFEAQNSAVSGKLPLLPPDPWKPSYGIYFNLNPVTAPNTGPDVFYYFADLDQDKLFDYGVYSSCPTGECLEKININNGNYISSIKSYGDNGAINSLTDEVHINFTRPSQVATFSDKNGNPFVPTPQYLEINISSNSGATTKVKIYPSGRIQLN